MRVELAYGHEVHWAEIPEENFLGILSSKHLPAVGDVSDAVLEALRNPVGSAPLEALIRRDRMVTLVIGDTTRGWARPDLYVQPLVNELNRLGVADRLITIVSATGTHRQQTTEEHLALVGPEVLGRVRLVDHNCHDSDALVHVGTTSRGTPVRINRLVAEAEQLIICGGVVQHFLAGFGGGRKSIIPGVSGYDTIQTNHKLALHPARGGGLHSNIDSLVLDGNVIAEDMAEAAAMVKPCFGLNIIINEDMEIAKVIAGHWYQAFRAATEAVRETIVCPIEVPADLVIVSSGGYPKDINMWQGSKTIDNATRAVRPGGVMLWLCRCNEGLGAEEFVTALEQAANMQESEDLMRRDFTIGALVAYVIQSRAAGCRVLIATEMEEQHCRRLGLEKVSSLADGLRTAYAHLGSTPRTYVMPHGGSTMPVVSPRSLPVK